MNAWDRLPPELKARAAILDIASAQGTGAAQLAQILPEVRIVEVQGLISGALTLLAHLPIRPVAEHHEWSYEIKLRHERDRNMGAARQYQDLYAVYQGLRVLRDISTLDALPLDPEAVAALSLATGLLHTMADALHYRVLPDDLTQAALQQAAADS